MFLKYQVFWHLSSCSISGGNVCRGKFRRKCFDPILHAVVYAHAFMTMAVPGRGSGILRALFSRNRINLSGHKSHKSSVGILSDVHAMGF